MIIHPAPVRWVARPGRIRTTHYRSNREIKTAIEYGERTGGHLLVKLVKRTAGRGEGQGARSRYRPGNDELGGLRAGGRRADGHHQHRGRPYHPARGRLREERRRTGGRGCQAAGGHQHRSHRRSVKRRMGEAAWRFPASADIEGKCYAAQEISAHVLQKSSVRHGCSPNARQIRSTFVGASPSRGSTTTTAHGPWAVRSPTPATTPCTPCSPGRSPACCRSTPPPDRSGITPGTAPTSPPASGDPQPELQWAGGPSRLHMPRRQVAWGAAPQLLELQ